MKQSNTYACFFLLCLVFLTFITSTVRAQSSFEAGYLVTLSGDSLRGFLDSRHWLEGADRIRYKAAPDRPVQVFTPREIASFYVAGEWYERKAVTVDETPLKARVEKAETRPSSRRDTLFLAVVVKGALRLYTFRDTRPHYYVESEAGIEELISHEYIATRGKGYSVVAEEGYKEQIRRLRMQCPSVAINKINFTERKLRRFVAQCDASIDPGSVQVANKVKGVSLTHGLLAGASRAKLEVAEPYYYQRVSFSPSYNLSLGYFMDVRLRGGGRESIMAGIQVRRISIDESEPSVYHTEFCPVTGNGACEYRRHYTTWNDVHIHTTELESFITGRVRFFHKAVRPFIEAGFTVAVPVIFDTEAFTSHAIFLLEPGSGPIGEWEETEQEFQERVERSVPKTRNVTVGVIAGLGIEYGKWNLTWRIEPTAGFAGAQKEHAPLQFVYLYLGYTF